MASFGNFNEGDYDHWDSLLDEYFMLEIDSTEIELGDLDSVLGQPGETFDHGDYLANQVIDSYSNEIELGDLNSVLGQPDEAFDHGDHYLANQMVIDSYSTEIELGDLDSVLGQPGEAFDQGDYLANLMVIDSYSTEIELGDLDSVLGQPGETFDNGDYWANWMVVDSYSTEIELGDLDSVLGQLDETFDHGDYLANQVIDIDLLALLLSHEPDQESETNPRSESFIESLKTVKPSKPILETIPSTCSICIVDFDMEKDLTELPCGNWFHRDCVVQWLAMKNTCPLCRHELF